MHANKRRLKLTSNERASVKTFGMRPSCTQWQDGKEGSW